MLFRSESNSLTHTLLDCPTFLPKEDECYIYKCDDPMDYCEIPMIDELDICYRGNILQDSNKEKQLDTLPTVIHDNPCYFDKSFDNPLFVPTIDMHDNEEVCLENLYDNALDDGLCY